VKEIVEGGGRGEIIGVEVGEGKGGKGGRDRGGVEG